MGLKKQFVEKITEHYPSFTKEGSVEIEFCGGGDNFDSFHSISVWDKDYKTIEGDWKMDTDEDMDFLFELLDNAGVDYDWNNAGTVGRINYEDGELRVETTISTDCYGEVDDDDDEEETQN